MLSHSDEDMETEGDEGNTQPSGEGNGMINSNENGAESQTQKPKLRLKYEQYKNISNLIVGYMQSMESKLGEGDLSLLFIYLF